MDGGAGNDYLGGVYGNDTTSYTSAATSVTVDLSLTGQQNTLGAGSDTLVQIENLIGSVNADTLTGDGGINRLNGGDGGDILTGGGRRDVFVFNVGEAGGDTIVDFAGGGAGLGDSLVFVGYGDGSFTQVGVSNVWTVTSEDGLTTELITFANGAPVDPSDYIFT